MTRHLADFVLAAALSALAFAPAVPALAQSAAPVADDLAPSRDSPRATPAGNTFTAPAGWSMRTAPNMVVLNSPEGDSHMAIVDVEAPDAAAATASAWKTYRADAKWPLKVSTKQAPRNGWTERYLLQYETSPNERATVLAVASRAGAGWAVLIVDASDMTFEKRGSQFRLVGNSLRPKGYTRETFAGKKAHPLDAQRIEVLKRFVAEGMKELDIPGVGLAFIDGGRIVWEGGVGVKELGKPEPIDKDTLFIAASNTKSLTTLLLAELVDEKKMRWDERVTDIYPAFKLGDAETTRQVLVKHLICACTGLPRQDFEWLFTWARATPESNMRLLGTMQPTSGFGQLFQYSNLMASAAGFIGAALLEPRMELGAAYDQAMQRKVFDPLAMKNTTFDFKRVLAGNYARPHGRSVDSEMKVIAMDMNYSIIPARPAGGVWTSAHDLALYVQMELARGKLPNGKRLVSEENLLARRVPQVAVGEDVAYGMGLFIDTQWGIPIIYHGGDLFGFHSNMYWLPDHDVGLVILTNADGGGLLRAAFLRRALEVLFDGKSEAQPGVTAAAATQKAQEKKERERLVIPADPAYADKLAARYSSAELGNVDVKRSATGVVFDFGAWKTPVASRKNDDGTTSFVTIDPAITGLEFVVAERGGKRALVIRDAQHEYVYSES
jgi:CubicO group peptidase (beta-lactamase class C family)